MDMIFDISGEQLLEEHKYNRYSRIEGLRFSEKPANEIGRFLKIAEGKLSRANQATGNATLLYLWPSKVFDESKDKAGYSPKHVAKEFECSSITVLEYNDDILSHQECPKKMMDEFNFKHIYKAAFYFLYAACKYVCKYPLITGITFGIRVPDNFEKI